MARFSIILALLVVNFAAASYIPRSPAGTQFITGACSSDADCASECCGFNSGKCAGPIIAQERDGGCGHGDAQPNDNAARKLRGEAPAQTDSSASSGSNNGSTGTAGNNDTSTTGTGAANNGTTSTGSGKAPGTQFITGVCASDSECASSCCGFNSGKCAGPVVAQERDGGCGFGDPTPNDDAARKIRGQAPAGAGNGSSTTSTSTSTGTDNGSTDTNGTSTSTDTGAANNGSSTAAGSTTSGSTSTGSGKPPGTQFITGVCASDSECASSCCGFKSGKCAGPIIAQERDGGCGFGDAQPNDTAAKKLRGQ